MESLKAGIELCVTWHLTFPVLEKVLHPVQLVNSKSIANVSIALTLDQSM